MTTSTSVSLADAQELYSQLKNDDSIKVSIVYNTGINAQFEGQEIEYSIADLNALSVQIIIPVKNIEDNYIIISESFARTHNLKIYDYVDIKAPDTYRYDSKGYRLGIEKEGKNCTLQIACIIQDNKMMYQDAYIDIYNLDFMQESAWVNKIYINGDYQYIDNKLENMKNDFPYLKWANYSDVLMINNRDIDNRYLMIEIVVRILVIIASIGWINSLRNIFLSRVKDYDIIRMQGVSRIRLAKIMVYQIITYLLNGTILGCIIGSLIVEALIYRDQNRLTFDINFGIVYQMIVIMLLFCLLLIPVIRKICNKQLLSQFSQK
ncbi:ABC transporter permease [Anaerosporobacter faecicola]|uniref:ABC transporter permease n=1 Tax=Anaerosporobacter faecicola TaxID=2718714 RepID=UPI001439BBCA|nr:FtsX-like permease family protein [Anaerosporobacter faecicola]